MKQSAETLAVVKWQSFFCGERLAATPTKTLFEEWFKREILKVRKKQEKQMKLTDEQKIAAFDAFAASLVDMVEKFDEEEAFDHPHWNPVRTWSVAQDDVMGAVENGGREVTDFTELVMEHLYDYELCKDNMFKGVLKNEQNRMAG